MLKPISNNFIFKAIFLFFFKGYKISHICHGINLIFSYQTKDWGLEKGTGLIKDITDQFQVLNYARVRTRLTQRQST